MQIGIHNVYDVFNIDNKIFDEKSYLIGQNLGYPFILLKEKLNEKKIPIDTLDQYPIEKYNKIIFLDYPSNNIDLNKLYNMGIELYLVIFESEIIKKDNWDKKNHKYFKKIFTWDDDLIDGKKYFNIKWPNKIPENIEFDISKKEKLCTLIAGNKKNKDIRELYSERVKAIKWFEKTHPEDFDLYGIGWDLYYFGSPFGKLNRFKSIRKIFKNNYRSYNGKVDFKNEVLSKYKFSICYENAKDIPGYITEKIFDSFFAGCVPVYWGAPNIKEFIPQECFIDKTKFDTYEELYNHLKHMSDDEYEGYLISIEKYLKSEKINQFSAEKFASEVINEILEESKNE